MIKLIEQILKVFADNHLFDEGVELIGSCRRKIDKSLKDLQQAICTSVILNKEELLKLFNSLPKKWKKAILQMLEKSKNQLPLLIEEIDKLEFTLQNVNTKIM